MRDRRTIQEKEAEGTGETFKRNERDRRQERYSR